MSGWLLAFEVAKEMSLFSLYVKEIRSVTFSRWKTNSTVKMVESKHMFWDRETDRQTERERAKPRTKCAAAFNK